MSHDVPRVGFIGLGRMGALMCSRQLEAGRTVIIHNRTRSREEPLALRGARRAASPAEVARHADVVISMVADDPALEAVVLGAEGVLCGAERGLVYVDMSTVSPAVSARTATACEAARVDYVRAPVTGSTAMAAEGKLGILASGRREAIDRIHDILTTMGQRVFYLGDAEQARVMKLALNMVIATSMLAFAEALTLGRKAGIGWEQMLSIFADSAAGSPLVKYKAEQLRSRDLAPSFAVELMVKDLDLALAAAAALDVATPSSAVTRQLYQATAGFGWGGRDFAAVLLLLEKMSGMGDS